MSMQCFRRCCPLFLGVIANCVGGTGWAQPAATKAPTATVAEESAEAVADKYLKNSGGAYVYKKDKDGAITHVMLVGKAPVRKSLGVKAEDTALVRAKAFATGELPLFIKQKVNLYRNIADESLTLTEGDATGTIKDNSKSVEKTEASVKQVADEMIRGVQPFASRVEGDQMVVVLLWKKADAAAAAGVADANNPPPPPQPRPPQANIREGTAVAPNAGDLLK